MTASFGAKPRNLRERIARLLFGETIEREAAARLAQASYAGPVAVRVDDSLGWAEVSGDRHLGDQATRRQGSETSAGCASTSAAFSAPLTWETPSFDRLVPFALRLPVGPLALDEASSAVPGGATELRCREGGSILEKKGVRDAARSEGTTTAEGRLASGVIALSSHRLPALSSDGALARC
jgi:hypothetical protein